MNIIKPLPLTRNVVSSSLGIQEEQPKKIDEKQIQKTHQIDIFKQLICLTLKLHRSTNQVNYLSVSGRSCLEVREPRPGAKATTDRTNRTESLKKSEKAPEYCVINLFQFFSDIQNLI